MSRVSILACAAIVAANSSCIIIAGSPTADANSRVVSVTVYQDRAMITRESRITLVPGIQEVTLGSLPPLLQDESVRVSARGVADAKILEVRVHRKFFDTVSAARLRPLVERSKQIMQRLRELRDRAAVVTQQKDFIAKIGIASQESIAHELKTQHPSIQDWRNLLGFFDAELTRLDGEAREIDDQINQTQQSYQTVNQEMRAIGGNPEKSEKQVSVTFDAPRGGTVTLQASYLIASAGWTPRYDIRVQSADTVVSLTYAADVRQNTGEDWKNATLTLSTSRPSSGGAPPEILPWFVGLAEHAVGTLEGSVRDAESGEPIVGAQVQTRLAGRSTTSDVNGSFTMTGIQPGTQEVDASAYGYITQRALTIIRPFSATRIDLTLQHTPVTETNISFDNGGLKTDEVTSMAERPVIEKNLSSSIRVAEPGARPAPAAPPPPPTVLYQTAGVSNAATAASFDIPGETTIPSDNERHRVTITVESLGASFSHTASPKLQTDVFFKASLRNTTEYPLLAGPLSVFVDNGFVSTSKLPPVMPGEPFEAFLGADNGLRVSRRLVNRVADVSGVFSKTRTTRYEILLTAENRKKTTQPLVLKENIPVSQDERIKVTVELPRPEEMKPDAGGIYTWDVRLAPGEKREFRLKYSIEAPADLNVGGIE